MKEENRVKRFLNYYENIIIFYQENGHIDVPKDYSVIDRYGKEINLYKWLKTINKKNSERALTDFEIESLKKIGYIFSVREQNNFNNFQKLVNFYKHYGHLDIPMYFKTKDGVNFDSEGNDLCWWSNNLKKRLNGQGFPLTDEEIKILESINFNYSNKETKFINNFELLLNYYLYNGDTSIPNNFCTLDGVNESKEGFNLYKWTRSLKNRMYQKDTFTELEKELLDSIDFKYEVHQETPSSQLTSLLNFYEYYGHLRIPSNFITKDGIVFDENGKRLTSYIATLRKRANGFGKEITKTEQEILDKINFDPKPKRRIKAK